MFMNDYDLEYARRRFTRSSTPNRLALVLVVDNLREWADNHSDGWAHWPKPARAAARAMELIASSTHAENEEQERNDITDEEMLAAVKPIKAFLTRAPKYGAAISPDEREIILRAVQS